MRAGPPSLFPLVSVLLTMSGGSLCFKSESCSHQAVMTSVLTSMDCRRDTVEAALKAAVRSNICHLVIPKENLRLCSKNAFRTRASHSYELYFKQINL